jgi:hypothetical protein
MTHLVQRTWRGADTPIFVKEYPFWDGRMVCRGALNSRRMSCNIKESAGRWRYSRQMTRVYVRVRCACRGEFRLQSSANRRGLK